jgi:diphthamide biosynthesis methyltransferase
MNQYTYFALDIVLGISLAVYYFMNREEKIEKRIVLDQQIYSTPKLDKTMENVVDKINLKIKEFKRELTEEEKNEIIKQCYQEKFL